MSKKISSCFLAFVIAMSCNKPLPDYSHIPFDYTVTGIGDVTVPANDAGTFSANATLVSGDAAKEPITMTLTGLPANVTPDTNNLSFRANFGLGIKFIARNAMQGVYPMQAVFANAHTGVKTYDFNLIIAPPLNRVAGVIGGYYPSNSCMNNIYISCEIDSVPGSPNKIILVDRTSPSMSYYGDFDTAYGYVDCCTNTFTIPSQRVQNTTVQGSGSFSGQPGDRKVILNRTIITDTMTYTCLVSLSQP